MLVEEHDKPRLNPIPTEYRCHHKVFSEEAVQRFPELRIWDHAIELKPGAPSTLPRKIYALSQLELQELAKFIKEHLAKGYIRPSKSPYAAPFFFIKKKDGKLRPVQDYRRLNELSSFVSIGQDMRRDYSSSTKCVSVEYLVNITPMSYHGFGLALSPCCLWTCPISN